MSIAILSRIVINPINYLIDILGLLVYTFKETRHLLDKNKRKLFIFFFKRQLFNTGIKAIYVNCLIAILFGMVTADRLFLLIPPSTHLIDFYAEWFVIIFIRELGPLISGFVLIARSATAITAEIGHLKFHNEFEVLKGQKISPIFIFLMPVFFSFPLSLLLMFFFFNFFCMGSVWIYLKLFSDNTIVLFDFITVIINHISLTEVLILSSKAIMGGSFIGLISIHSATMVTGRFTDISRSLSKVTTMQLLGFFVINISLSVLAY